MVRTDFQVVEMWIPLRYYPHFPQPLLLRLLQILPFYGDISTLWKKGHFYFGLTAIALEKLAHPAFPFLFNL